MRIKKFVGQTFNEATSEMKRVMGPDAVVIDSRKFSKGGVFNFLAKEYVEVTAAVDEQSAGSGLNGRSAAFSSTPLRKGFAAYQEAALSKTDIELNSNLENLKRVAEQFSKKRLIAEDETDQKPEKAAPRAEERYTLANEVSQIKETLRELSEHIKYTKMPALPETLKKAYLNMISQDIDEKLSADIVQGVYGRLHEEQYYDKKLIDQHILREIENIVAGKELVRRGSRRKNKIVALVGPTGVGKTTTVAKLASINKLVNELEVGLISVDTFRIGAIEQLRTFAAIADIPMEVVYKPSEMQNALRKLRGSDIIFIDTVGRSQRKPKELSELKRFVEASKPDEIHLVLGASTTPRGMLDIASRFSVMKPNRIIFSKLDEAVSFGPLLNVSKQYGIPISYVTVGQDVPDDILAADPVKFASMVYTGVIPNE